MATELFGTAQARQRRIIGALVVGLLFVGAAVAWRTLRRTEVASSLASAPNCQESYTRPTSPMMFGDHATLAPPRDDQQPASCPDSALAAQEQEPGGFRPDPNWKQEPERRFVLFSDDVYGKSTDGKQPPLYKDVPAWAFIYRHVQGIVSGGPPPDEPGATPRPATVNDKDCNFLIVVDANSNKPLTAYQTCPPLRTAS